MGSLLVMAIVGGALMPLLMGKIADVRHSIAPGYLVLLLAYIIVAIYAFAGSRPRYEQSRGDWSLCFLKSASI